MAQIVAILLITERKSDHQNKWNELRELNAVFRISFPIIYLILILAISLKHPKCAKCYSMFFFLLLLYIEFSDALNKIIEIRLFFYIKRSYFRSESSLV